MSDRDAEREHWERQLRGDSGETGSTSGADDKQGGQSRRGFHQDPVVGDAGNLNDQRQRRNHPDDRREAGALGTLKDKDEYIPDIQIGGKFNTAGGDVVDAKHSKIPEGEKGRFSLD